MLCVFVGHRDILLAGGYGEFLAPRRLARRFAIFETMFPWHVHWYLRLHCNLANLNCAMDDVGLSAKDVHEKYRALGSLMARAALISM
jgi:hypothetical protein